MSEEPHQRQIQWTTVHVSSMSEAIVCQGLLESNGIPTMILNQNVKIIDPFLAGGQAFRVELQTLPEFAEKARELLEWRPPRPTDGEEHVEPDQERIEGIGRRIRWSSITILTAPYALWLAPSYLLGASKLARKPRNHGWTLAAIGFGGCATFVAATIFLRR